MTRLLALIGFFLLAFVAHAAQPSRFIERSTSVHGTTYRYRLFVPDGWTAKRSWPVVLFLHGSGERGSDNERQLSQGLPPWLKDHGDHFPAVVVIPQAPEGTAWNGDVEVMALQALKETIDTYHGDRRRLYLTGLSMGGYGSWQIAKDHLGMFAAAAIICGGINQPKDPDPLSVQGIPAGTSNRHAWVAAHIGKLPVWIFNGAIDSVVPPDESHRMNAALKALGDDVRYTEFPGVDHGSWPMAYATAELWPWMFSHQLAGVHAR
ncbi:dienelactone hydrolase family protein [Rhodanobacter sp. L36]|uniref:carboxylesterase family protein n=1 Tax=Rhodanobacter sp. L36 TaxID=1747221 RepID=UPI00131C29F2|nr:dienelactone hydrolase family protein [Rhodanobacter sp. L36]